MANYKVTIEFNDPDHEESGVTMRSSDELWIALSHALLAHGSFNREHYAYIISEVVISLYQGDNLTAPKSGTEINSLVEAANNLIEKFHAATLTHAGAAPNPDIGGSLGSQSDSENS